MSKPASLLGFETFLFIFYNKLSSDNNSAHAALQTSINSEASNRELGDATLNSRIDGIIAPTGSAPYPDEIVDARIDIRGTSHSTLGGAIRSQLNNVVSFTGNPYPSPSDYNNLMSNIIDNITTLININGWTDLPPLILSMYGGALISRRYADNYNIQTLETVNPDRRALYHRIIQRSNKSIYGDWVKIYDVPRFKILAIGDSICRGRRNSNKGFVGDLEYPYINMGVGGATISSIHSTYTDSIHQYSTADNIPNQLITYSQKSSSEIRATFGIAKFTPDIIIANGGINDYWRGAMMGTLSNVPVTTDAEANALDRNTLFGSLEYLFYQMIKLYRKAQRYFVIMHKIGSSDGTYWPTLVKAGGYNQEQLHNAIIDCCNMYGVIPVDVYKDGIMNTKFQEYKTTADDYINAGSTDYCDKDGVHPLEYGYKQVYASMIKAAIMNATLN